MTPAAFIRRAKRLGFSEREARDLAGVRPLEGACEAFQGRLQARRRALRRRMAALEAEDMELTLLLVACWRQQGSGDCAVRWELSVRGRPPIRRGVPHLPANARVSRAKIQQEP